MYRPKISVVLPAYNVEETIGNILEKLTSQSYKNIEIIVVNDGSIDNSWRILQEFSRIDSRIVAIDQKNAGVGAARNVGIKKATGEFIMFIDSDDDISGKLVSELTNHTRSDSDFVVCGMDINGKVMVAPDVFIDDSKVITQYVLKSLLTKNLLYGPYCKLYRRSIVSKNKILFPEDVKYGEDTIFILNYLCHVRNITNIQKTLYTYNFQPSGLASNNNLNVAFRKARVDALREFMSKNNSSLRNVVLYSMIQVRWSLAFVKCILRSGNVRKTF